MKIFYLFLAGIFLLSLCSCKKIYTCNCSTAYTFKDSHDNNYTTVTIPGSKTAYTEKMKQSQAKEACSHEQNTIQTDFTNGITNNGNYSLQTGESIVTTCNINL